MKRIRTTFLAMVWGVAGIGSAVASPFIQITNVPSFGSFDNLGGLVVDADPVTHRVAVFIYVPSAGWWSKPYCSPALTPIQPDGSWTADITTGGVDEFATQFSALLSSSRSRGRWIAGTWSNTPRTSRSGNTSPPSSPPTPAWPSPPHLRRISSRDGSTEPSPSPDPATAAKAERAMPTQR